MIEDLPEGLQPYLENLRKVRNIPRTRIAEYGHSKYPNISTVHFSSYYIDQFENGFRHLKEALDNREPQRSLFCLYIEGLKLNKGERHKVLDLINQRSFSLKPDEKVLLSIGRSKKPKLLITKLKALPQEYRKRIENTIDKLYDEHVWDKQRNP